MYSPRSVRLWLAAFALSIAAALSFGPFPTSAGEASARPARRSIYDEKADGARQVADALAQARKEKKRVLLMFGANWCGWCHRLHQLFEQDAQIQGVLKRDYVLALIDVNQGHNADVDRQYGQPTRHGLPVLVVLEADGNLLTTQDTGKLEDGDHHDPAKVLAFLREWAPAPGKK